ncbi:transposase (fragment) [Micrococcus sp. 116]
MSRFQMLSDAQWELIAPMLPTRTGRAGRPFADARAMVEAIIYRYRCGIAWRDRLVEGQAVTNWKQALAQLAAAYPDRINPYL